LGKSKLRTEQQTGGFFLPSERATGGMSDPVGRRDQQPIAELRSCRLAQERVNVRLFDRVRRVIRLRLDRPEAPLARLRHEVDSRVSGPPPRPLIPQPYTQHL